MLLDIIPWERGTPMTQTNIALSDGSNLLVRSPDISKDVEKLKGFFSGLPTRIRNYLRYDATDEALLRGRLGQLDGMTHWRLIAELDGEIVADATMDREPYGWTRHVANLRAVAKPRLAGKGIKRILFRELLTLGREAGIERFDTEVISSQAALIQALIGDGFSFEATRKKYARDIKGRLHDVVILSNNHHSIWSKLEKEIEDLDIRLPELLSGS